MAYKIRYGPQIHISGGFCVLLAVMVLLVPLPWLVACMVAAVFHELCHYAAIRLLCGDCAGIFVHCFAAKLPLPEMSATKEILCALAGPAGGLLLLCLSPWLPRIGLCAAVQSMYNLIPIYPLDGGRALRCGLSMVLKPPMAERVSACIGQICKWGIVWLGIYGSLGLGFGIFPLLLAALFWIRVK